MTTLIHTKDLYVSFSKIKLRVKITYNQTYYELQVSFTFLYHRLKLKLKTIWRTNLVISIYFCCHVFNDFLNYFFHLLEIDNADALDDVRTLQWCKRVQRMGGRRVSGQRRL